MMSSENDRPRGVFAYVMPESVCGPMDRYALIIRPGEARMVHTEGVAYLVTAEKPWQWNDYGPDDAPVFTLSDLVHIAATTNEVVDLADWVRTFGARLESNFNQVYAWATQSHVTHYPGKITLDTETGEFTGTATVQDVERAFWDDCR